MRKVYYFKQSIESFFCLCLVDPVKVQAICDIFQNCEMGEESIILVDNADAPFFRRQSGDVLFSNENLATLYGNQTCYGFQKYCLACPGRTHENEKFILLYAQIDIAKIKSRETYVEVFYPNHASLVLRKVRIRSIRKRTRQIETSQTATGWEYFRP